jgi:hypothetical protein
LSWGAGESFGAEVYKFGLGLLLGFGGLIDLVDEVEPALAAGLVVEGGEFGFGVRFPLAVLGFVKVEEVKEGLSKFVVLLAEFFGEWDLGLEAGLESADGALDGAGWNALGLEVLRDMGGAIGKEV